MIHLFGLAFLIALIPLASVGARLCGSQEIVS